MVMTIKITIVIIMRISGTLLFSVFLKCFDQSTCSQSDITIIIITRN